MRRLAVVFLFLPLLAAAQGTGTLAGRVTDAETGEALPGASVLIRETPLSTTTDVDGRFRIIDVPGGTYNVAAYLVGYEVETVEAVEIRSGLTRGIGFRLEAGVTDA